MLPVGQHDDAGIGNNNEAKRLATRTLLRQEIPPSSE
jgi:hypothetical protein